MRIVMKSWSLVLGTIMFCSGVFLLLFCSTQYMTTLQLVRDNYKNNSEMYQQYTDYEKDVVTYQQLTATLYNPLDYNIRIDGLFISKTEHTRESISSYGIRKIYYIKSYSYDSIGNVTEIDYTGITG